jgi:hypothetical protein
MIPGLLIFVFVVASGENDNNELGRSGKKSLLQRVDAVETSILTEVAAGYVCSRKLVL